MPLEPKKPMSRSTAQPEHPPKVTDLLILLSSINPLGLATGATGATGPANTLSIGTVSEGAAAAAGWACSVRGPMEAAALAMLLAVSARRAVAAAQRVAPAVASTAVAVPAVRGTAAVETALAAQSASSGAPVAATRPPIRRTFEGHERHHRPRRRPARRLKATRKEQQHDAPSSAP